MAVTAKGNFNSTSISRLGKKKDLKNKDNGREMDWSAGKKGIDERIGMFQYLMHPKKGQWIIHRLRD